MGDSLEENNQNNDRMQGMQEQSKFEGSLEYLLLETGGFGKYEMYVFFLLCIAVLVRSSVSLVYVFTGSDISYRWVLTNVCLKLEVLVIIPDLKN